MMYFKKVELFTDEICAKKSTLQKLIFTTLLH